MAFKKSIMAAVLSLGIAAAQTPQSGVVSAGQGNPYQRARQLPARIMEFKAEPSSVQPGQPVTLHWSAENPMGTTIEPGIGRVTPRGAIQVTPKVTTTYILTVRGPNNHLVDVGSVKWKVAPGPSFAVAHNRPPWFCTIDRQIDSPIPIPPGFVV